MNKLFHIIPAIVFLLSFAGCQIHKQDYRIENYYQENQKDSLLVNIVTYIGYKPKLADYQTRHNPEHREFYKEQSAGYNIYNYYISSDSIHYYYLIRPARSPRGNLRGVGGRFKVTEKLKFYEFEEIFNTPVFPEEELIDIGKILFREMINSGNVDKYSGNIEYIEWPDDRLKYDRNKNEWRYDVAD
jgi:hypothetical protein